MTQKELSYVEDAISHEESIISICQTIVGNLQDENLKEFIQNEINTHMTMRDKLINILEVKANG